MGVVLKQIEKRYPVRRTMAALVSIGIVAFLASSTVNHKTLNELLAFTSGLGVALPSLSGALGEISPALRRWAIYTSCMATGVTLGILARVVLR